jgi:hypothetical protein
MKKTEKQQQYPTSVNAVRLRWEDLDADNRERPLARAGAAAGTEGEEVKWQPSRD